jgi:hypothetical protein
LSADSVKKSSFSHPVKNSAIAQTIKKKCFDFHDLPPFNFDFLKINVQFKTEPKATLSTFSPDSLIPVSKGYTYVPGVY